MFNADQVVLGLSQLGLTVIASSVIAVVVYFFSTFYGDKLKHAFTIVIMAVAVAAIISVIKESLALSLGLVGALSIVRFRTPIKEPEQLLHLFVAIVIGIAMGADMPEIVLAVICIFSLSVVGFWFFVQRKRIEILATDEAFFSVTFKDDEPNNVLNEARLLFDSRGLEARVRNVMVTDGSASINFTLTNAAIGQINEVAAALNSKVGDGNLNYDIWVNAPQID